MSRIYPASPDVLHVCIPGEPIAKGRPRMARITTRNGKVIARVYTPKRTASFEGAVRLLCAAQVSRVRWRCTPEDRFELDLLFRRTHENAGGDLDNYVKAVLDGMNGVAFVDDAQVRRLYARLEQSDQPQTIVTVSKLAPGRTE